MKITLLILAIIVELYIASVVCKHSTFVRWIKFSLTYTRVKRRFRTNLYSLNAKQRCVALSEWLSSDFWYKKFWFGRRLTKFVIKELNKLT